MRVNLWVRFAVCINLCGGVGVGMVCGYLWCVCLCLSVCLRCTQSGFPM